MRKHLQYLKYFIRHKWFVFQACRRCGVGLWRSIIHDWTKFLPCEWFAYVNELYGDWKQPDDLKYWCYRESIAFKKAWNHHQKTNKHHWQYWFLTNDSDSPKHVTIEMPEKYAREMVADWWGAGRAITGRWDALSWYGANKEKILLHDSTRIFVEELLNQTSKQYIQDDENLARRIRILGY